MKQPKAEALAEHQAPVQEPVVCTKCGASLGTLHLATGDKNCPFGQRVQHSDCAPQPAQQETVKRYEPEIFREDRIRMELDSDGDWVKYADVVALIAKSTAQRKPLTDEPVRIYDYVWPQRDEHKEECVYACSYTPGHHLARGELLAVVHPSQLKNAYLQRDDEAAHGIKENT